MLVDLLRTRRWLRRLLSGLSVLLLLGGVGLVGFPFATNMWQGRIQERLDDQIASPELQQAYKERKIETGDSLTRIKIPALGLDTVVVEGITPSALRAGAGKLVTVTLGRYPDLSLKVARELAARQRQALKDGANINAEKRARRDRVKADTAAPTLREIIGEYQSAFADKRASWRPDGPRTSRSNAQRCIEAVFQDLLDRPVARINATELADAMSRYVPRSQKTSSKSTANGQVSRARAYLAPVLDWAAARGSFARVSQRGAPCSPTGR